MILAERYDAFLFDLDGVCYRGAEPIEEAPEAVARLRSLGKRVAFVTNNSSRTPEAVVETLRDVGIAAIADEVVTSALVTADLMVSRGMVEVFVVGEEGIVDAMRAKGIRIADGSPDRVEAVVVGLDRHADYAKLTRASLLIERGAALVATNADASFPAPDGAWPGAGALLAAIEATTAVRAEVVGKPHPPLLRAALDRAGGGRPLLIGDRLDTDIAGAVGLGWDSLLVLTGISTRDELARAAESPTYVGDDLSTLFRTRG